MPDNRQVGVAFVTTLSLAAISLVIVAVIDVFGKVVIEVNEDGLVIRTCLLGATRIPREDIDGFWVLCYVDEYGTIDFYALMVDERAVRKRKLFGPVQQPGPPIALAEALASRLRVPSDTRGRSVD